MEGRRDLAKGRGECNERIPLALGHGRASGERQSVRAEMDSVPTPRGKSSSPLSCSVRPRRNFRIRNLLLGAERAGSGQGTAYSNLNFPRRQREAGRNGAPATELKGGVGAKGQTDGQTGGSTKL